MDGMRNGMSRHVCFFCFSASRATVSLQGALDILLSTMPRVQIIPNKALVFGAKPMVFGQRQGVYRLEFFSISIHKSHRNG